MTHSFKNSLTSAVGLVLLVVHFANAKVPLSCITCEGIGCLRTSVVKTQNCLDPLDICMTIFNGFEVVKKGCSLEIPMELRKKCDSPDGVECHKCNTNKCNNLGRNDFRCIQCDSSRDPNCKSNPKSIEPTRCGSPTAPNSYCFVRYDSNAITVRGCSTDVKAQQDCFKSGSCMLCMPGDLVACNAADFTSGSLRSFIF